MFPIFWKALYHPTLLDLQRMRALGLTIHQGANFYVNVTQQNRQIWEKRKKKLWLQTLK